MNRGGLQPSPRRCGSSVSKFNSGTEGGLVKEWTRSSRSNKANSLPFVNLTYVPPEWPMALYSDVMGRAPTSVTVPLRGGGEEGRGRVITGAAPVSPRSFRRAFRPILRRQRDELFPFSPTVCPSSNRSRNSCTIEYSSSRRFEVRLILILKF